MLTWLYTRMNIPPKTAPVPPLDGIPPDVPDMQLAHKTMTSWTTESGPLLGDEYLLVERLHTLGLGTISASFRLNGQDLPSC